MIKNDNFVPHYCAYPLQPEMVRELGERMRTEEDSLSKPGETFTAEYLSRCVQAHNEYLAIVTKIFGCKPVPMPTYPK